VARKVCTVRGRDNQGHPVTVLVEAASLFEATARGLEVIHAKGGQIGEVEVTVHEPGRTFNVGPDDLDNWIANDDSGNIGLRSLKSRIRRIIEGV
jgi:hypothetical protein